jgi:hypothetical protein
MRFHRASPIAAGVAALAAALALAACGSSGPDQATLPTQRATALPTATAPPGLPFHYEAQGQSSSPSFRVATAGAYKVDYILKGSTDIPGCTMSIALVADDGAAVTVVSGEKLQPTDTRQNSVPVTLKAGNWRF